MFTKKMLPILFVILIFGSGNLLTAQITITAKPFETIDVAGSSGVAIYKKGIVNVRRADSDYWQPVDLYSRFYPRDTIQTDKDSICEIKLYGDHVLRLEPSSNFSFAERNPGSDKWAAFKLNAGKLWIKVVNTAPNASSFILETPHASISVKGTMFSVEAPYGKVVAYEGVVQIAQGNLEITVNAGEQTKINQFGFMTNPEPIDTEGISAFDEFEKNVVYLNAKNIQSIKNTVVTPAKAKLKPKPTPTQKIINETKNITSNNVISSYEEQITSTMKIQNEPILNLLISKDKTLSILEDSLLFRNPAILSKIPINRMNTVYYASKGDLSVQEFNANYANNSYISDRNKVNAGENERIEENQILGVRTLERDTGVGVHFKKQRYLQMISSSNATLYQNNILNLFYGKSFQLDKNTNLGLLMRGSIITSTKETKTTFSQFSGMFSAGTESSFFYYGLDIGLLHHITQQFSLGVSYKGLLTPEILGFEEKTDNSLCLSGIFFDEYHTTEVSLKNNKNNTAILVNSIFQLPQFSNILFTAKTEFSTVSSLYSILTNVETSDTFQLFFKLSLEQMNEIADNAIITVGGQLDF
ncbi:MAG: FecR family protein [Candidatus Riflemargulisbacteria bacterium]